MGAFLLFQTHDIIYSYNKYLYTIFFWALLKPKSDTLFILKCIMMLLDFRTDWFLTSVTDQEPNQNISDTIVYFCYIYASN